jgi:hypothetical protein
MEIYNDVITRYLKMGAGQFLQDFRRDYHLKKSLALRKSLMLRKEKARKNKMKVHMAQIEQDRSLRKRSSHIRLLALVNDVKEEICSLYKKNELQHLCNAYKVRFLTTWNKAKLAKALVQAIPTFDHIPHHQITSNYTVETVETDVPDQGLQVPVLRLRRL